MISLSLSLSLSRGWGWGGGGGDDDEEGVSQRTVTAQCGGDAEAVVRVRWRGGVDWMVIVVFHFLAVVGGGMGWVVVWPGWVRVVMVVVMVLLLLVLDGKSYCRGVGIARLLEMLWLVEEEAWRLGRRELDADEGAVLFCL